MGKNQSGFKLFSSVRASLRVSMKSIIAVAATVAVGFAFAQEQSDSVSKEVEAAVISGITKARPQLLVQSVSKSPVDGLYRAHIENGPTLFVSGDGQYVLATDMYQVVAGGFVNLQEVERQETRAVLAKELDEDHDDLIVYSPEGEVKGVVNVFTDVDCGFCQRLHLEVAELNELGIELRYLAYPRSGLQGESYNKIASAWCAKDQQQAMDKLKAREVIESNICDDNPVAKHFALGTEIGVRGTPALLLADGTLLPGYLPAKELAERIGVAVN
jgi:thiol:disulfide interchange protein DsbC